MSFETELDELVQRHIGVERADLVYALHQKASDLINTADDMCPYPRIYERGECCGVLPCHRREEKRLMDAKRQERMKAT